MKIINPCSELKMVNMYLKAMVSELKLKSPNSQVSPSKGKTTTDALSPALTFTSRSLSLFPAPFTLTVTQIIRMNTTIFICVENSSWVSQFQQTRSRLQAVPFWLVERGGCAHSAAKLERGEINEKRLGERREGKGPFLFLSPFSRLSPSLPSLVRSSFFALSYFARPLD